MNYRTHDIDTFLDAIASETVAPAGGTAAAVSGAIGASLCEMAAVHTLNTDGYGDRREEMIAYRDSLRDQRSDLLELADSDAETISAMVTDSEDLPDHDLSRRARTIPLHIAESCLTVMKTGMKVWETGNPNAAPDSRTGIFLANAALRSTLHIVRHNLSQSDAQKNREEIERQVADVETAADAVFEQVNQ